eukprot:7812040-Ditylum_brightwellii.AAC.3
MLSQVDADGVSIHIMNGIVDYKRNDSQAVSREDIYVYNDCGTRKPWKTTVGWSLPVHWKDNSESWIQRKDMKEFHQVKVAKFAKARDIADEPAF